MSVSRLSFLLRTLYSSQLAENEQRELAELLVDVENESDIKGIMEILWTETPGTGKVFTVEKSREMLAEILNQDKGKGKAGFVSMTSIRKRRFWYAAAAAFLLIGTAAIIFNLTKKESVYNKLVKTNPVKTDIPPGGNRAVLTLSDGSQILLDSAGNGNLASQGSSKVIKLNGQISYKKSGQSNELLYNTITTPHGGQYQLILADGSSVWLNAASSLHFPASFSGKERKVDLTGEAYFEVAKNVNMPFVVEVNKMKVQVLGTHFNINAYTDELSVKTTLLEGVVKVSKGENTLLLTPGQQAQVTADDPIRLNKNVDLDEVVAWKNGLFRLSSADIPTVLRQIARWYDLEIIYEGKQPEGHISGTVPMSMPLSKVLNALELSGIDFRLEGNKLFIR